MRGLSPVRTKTVAVIGQDNSLECLAVEFEMVTESQHQHHSRKLGQ